MTPRSSDRARVVKELLDTYKAEQGKISLFLNQLEIALAESADLAPSVHSIRKRMKEPSHLRRKLLGKYDLSASSGTEFDISAENLLQRINDLAGIRILHLYTRQIQEIDAALRKIFEEQQYDLIEGPFARTWDDESRRFFKSCGIETEDSPTLYTSVHYVIGSASRSSVTCEIQVRTLMEEVWGEVDHILNYPKPTKVLACAEQINVLARVTSSATRLVDAIFLTWDEAQQARRKKAGSPRAKRTKKSSRPKAQARKGPTPRRRSQGRRRK